jgi:hypothetical protein
LQMLMGQFAEKLGANDTVPALEFSLRFLMGSSP